jgi:hypothetical protein
MFYKSASKRKPAGQQRINVERVQPDGGYLYQLLQEQQIQARPGK